MSDLMQLLREETARILSRDISGLHDATRLVDTGLDSVGAVALAARLSVRLGRNIPAWVVWQYPTIGALARGLENPAQKREPRAVFGWPGEPVAIVGMGCRLPGDIADRYQLWEFLVGGGDAVTEVPKARWDWATWAGAPGEAGTSTTRWGGFLSDIESFDHEHFTISPAEADQMDPQQRIALETAWSAFEDAGIDPLSLAGSRTGVFVGSMFEEYAAAVGATAADTAPQSVISRDASVIPARIAYTWGLRGPVLGLQTACSSSLTAVHLAVRSLQSGESDLALAGGVNLMLDPRTTVAMSAFGAMSPTGRCHPFGADADGYVRAEGCGLVVLRLLSDALVSGDTVLAVIVGSAINGDGASNGLTAPSPEAQELLLREAWADAGHDPVEATYVEAHGTGTLLGDPIEAHALATVLGRPRDTHQLDLLLGSSKSNFGHLEPAAGVVGLMKTALCLHHSAIPPSLHADQLNPHIDFSDSRLRLVRTLEPWPEGPRLAGVSSFGFGGSNAHVVLAGAPVPADQIAALASRPATVPIEGASPAVVLCFSGHGAQWPGMGADMLSVPAFHRVVMQVERACGLPLRRMMASGEPVTDTATVQPLLFAHQVATVEVLRGQGIRVDAVFGQSVGEVAAAVVAGALTLEEGARLITIWSAVVGDVLDQTGGVRVFPVPRELIDPLVAYIGPDVCVSAELSHDRTAVAGSVGALDALDARFTELYDSAGQSITPVNIAYPAHGPGTVACVNALRQRLGVVECQDSTVPFISTVEGRGLVAGSRLTADHWIANTISVSTVGTAVRTLPQILDLGHRRLVVVEVSPQRILAGPVERTLDEAGCDAVVVTTGTRPQEEPSHLLEVVDRLSDLGALDGPHRDESVVRALLLTATTARALSARATALADLLEESPQEVAGIAARLSETVGLGERRAAVVGRRPQELIAGLRALAVEPDRGRSRAVGAVALLFTGQGAQRVAMGRALCREVPTFERHLRRAITALDRHLEVSLEAVLDGATDDQGAVLIDQTQYTQPALFAIEAALAWWWQEMGLRPSAMAGHSIGEFVAAHVAGVMDLNDAARLVCARGALMAQCRADGAMASVEATEEELLAVIADRSDQLAMAGLNGPTQAVVSGDVDAVKSVVDHFAQRGRRTRVLQVSRAFHSPHMDDALEAFGAVARSCTFHPAQVPVISTLTAEPLPAPEQLANYWVDQLRGPVRFLDAIRRLEREGVEQYVECGPAPVLSTLASTCVSAEPAGGFVASLCAHDDEVTSLYEAAAALFVSGIDLQWDRLVTWAPTKVPVPGHIFARDRHWGTGSGFPARESRRLEAWWEAVDDERVDDLATMLDISAADRDALATVLPYLASLRRSLKAPVAQGLLTLEVKWLPVELETTEVAGAWVVVSAHPEAETLAQALAAASAGPVRLMTVSGAVQAGVLADTKVTGVVVDLRGATCSRDGELVTAAVVRDALRLAQAAALSPTGPLVWGLTSASAAVTDGDVVDPAAAALWGLTQVAALETDHRWRGLIDLDGPLDADAAALVVSAVGCETEEHIAVRAGTILARRLVEVKEEPAEPWRPCGTVLVTGSGSLAAHLTRWLAQTGADDVVLVSRSGRTVEVEGARVHARSCDVTDHDALRGLVSDLDAQGLMPCAVIHAAGVLDDRLLSDVDVDSLIQVADPKVQGATLLQEFFGELDAFIVLSSVVGVLGNPGQVTYAMANAALDGLVAQRRAAGLPGSSVAFGPWAGPGMASGVKGAQLRRAGMLPLQPSEALVEFAEVVGTGGSAVVADISWSDAAAAYGAAASHRALLREIPQAHSAAPVTTKVLAHLAGLPAAERAAIALDVVREEVAAVLEVADPTTIDIDRGLKDLGIDSMMALTISQRLTRRTAISVPRTITFDRPTPRAMAEWLHEQLTHGAETSSGPGHDLAPPTACVTDDVVAVVGVGLRLPGGAHDLDSFWQVLVHGVDTVVEVPSARFGRPPSTISGAPALASLLTDVEGFDAGFFGISPREAVTMDPQHRLLLETAWEALEQAGIVPGALRGSTTGVFIGSAGSEYGPEPSNLHELTGKLASFAAGRIAHHLGTQGPAYTLDTACSSSLAAVHLARESLLAGECDLALAGGAQVIADAAMFDALGSAGALAPDGRSKTFSAAADGYGRGEGAGVVALMRLSDALASDAPVFGVLLGSAVMHDGTSSGITTPNGASQQRVIRRALDAAGISPQSVDYVECHGTGTVLGDPIEVNALAAAYGPREPGMPLRLGTAKSVIGHLEAAAGIAGLCKVLASLRYEALPATLYSSPRNPHLDWDGLCVEVVDELTPWRGNVQRPRRAGVSAFGMSGTNVHLLVEQAPATVPLASMTPNEATTDLMKGESDV